MPSIAKDTFLPDKAEQIEGLQTTHYRELLAHRSVTLESGRVVQPSEVLEDAYPSQCFALIFMPDSTFLDSFLK
jgi:hypothetical protein